MYRDKAKKKYVCLLSHAEKNKGRSVGNNFFFSILFFIYELILDGVWNAFLHFKSDI